VIIEDTAQTGRPGYSHITPIFFQKEFPPGRQPGHVSPCAQKHRSVASTQQARGLSHQRPKASGNEKAKATAAARPTKHLPGFNSMACAQTAAPTTQRSPEMNSHNLAEQTAGLASRLNDLSMLTSGAESEKLLELRDQLSRFTMMAIETELDEEKAEYESACNYLAQAIAEAGMALTREAAISKVIAQAKQAIAATGKALA
jgi:hypothetical protein